MVRYNWLDRVAYGKTRSVKAVPKVSDAAAGVGVKVFQIMRVRPLTFGLRVAGPRRKRV